MSNPVTGHSCTCACHDEHTQNRREFLKLAGTFGAGLLGSPLFGHSLEGEDYHRREIFSNRSVLNGKTSVFTLLHTSDIHAQLYMHDEFFWEDGEPVYKKRGGLAVLKTMLQEQKAGNPGNTLLIDGGDCLQGGGLAALTQGKAIVPLINNLGYDIVLPGNWEVVYGKKMLLEDLGHCHAGKICANMFHDTNDARNGEMLFPPYTIKHLAGVKIGFIGYNDPLTPIRQSPAYSYGIKFTRPEENVAKYIHALRAQGCAMIFLVTHMGLAQQVDLANKKEIQGVDYILGADTHERVRKPIEGTYAKVTEPGAFGSFVARLDMVIENKKIKDANYQLLDVDPEKYKPDPSMTALIEKERRPHQKELDKVIGQTRTPLVRYYVIENPMDNMITDALMWKYGDTGADIVLSNGFRFCPPLVPSPDTGTADITNDFLWSMIPVDSEVKEAEVTGKQLWEWLEKELHNVFAKNPAERFGGWVIRFKGMEVNFTMKNELNKRLNRVNINGLPLDPGKNYHIVACEREGDPNHALCRMAQTKNPRKTGHTMHTVIREYLAVHSPVSPKIEGRIVATDTGTHLLSQLEGYDYVFR